MIKNCSNCAHWFVPDPDYNQITAPKDPDTYELMEMPFKVKECKSPKLLFCERPLEIDGFAVQDGSEYMAGLFTAEQFYCIKHELKGVN